MTKDVIITVCGLQIGPEVDGEPMEMITTGQYFQRNKKQYIVYEEAIEGETQTNHNRIKISPGRVELNKTGMLSVHMVFEENEKHKTCYYTPYGTLMMEIETKKITVSETENEIHIEIEYALEMNGEFVADCHIQINVKAKGEAELKLL